MREALRWMDQRWGARESRLAVAVIVLVFLLAASAYALKTPKWNNPDEPAHFNYVKHVATTGQLPVLQSGDWDQAYLERLKPLQFPDTLPIDSIRYESHQPPLYYLMAAPVYRLLEGTSTPLLVLGLRGVSIALGGLLLVLAYLIVREAAPWSHWLALGTAGFVATLPMHLAMTAAINNDTLAEVVMSLGLLLMLRGIRRGFSIGASISLGVVLGAALLTKVTIYPLLALAAVAVLARARVALPPRSALVQPSGRGESAAASFHIGQRSEPRAVAQITLMYGTAFLVSFWWFVRNMMTYGLFDPFGLVRHDAVVVGQPRTAYTPEALQHFLGTTFQSFWGQFGWMGIVLDRRIYLLAGLLSAAAGLGSAIAVWRWVAGRERLLALERWSIALMGASLVLVAGALVYYNLTFIQAQGRYLFYAIAPIGFFFVLGIASLVPRALVPIGILGLYLGLLALDAVSLIRFIAPAFGTL